MRRRLLIAAALAGALIAPAALATTSTAATPPGMRVVDGRLVEANGTPFVMRGVNHAHTWYTSRTQAFADISALGGNAVRTVLSSGDRWTRNSLADVQNVVRLAKEARLISVLEVHDTTGYGEEGAAVPLSKAVDYWVSIKEALIGQEDYVLVNIGNEPYGNNATVNESYAADTIEAITRLRAAGIRNTIVVDAPNWGQDWSGTMRASAQQIFDADPDANVVFSIHMYGVYNTATKVRDYLEAFQAAGLPIIVGEFGHDHSDGNPDEDAILAEAQARGIGWLAWSWSGNSGGVEYLDLAIDFNPNQLSPWGERLFNGPDGVAATTRRATIFDGAGPGPGIPDETAPSAPGRPTVSAITATGATLSWAASTDDVGVTGYVVRNADTGATLATATGTNATLTGLSPATSYSVNVVARDAVGNTSTPSPTATFTTSQGPVGGSCTAELRVVNDWPNGYQAEVRVTAGTSALTGWSTSFTVPAGGSIQNLWSGTASGASGAVTVTNAAWNGQVGAGQTVAYGFVGSGTPPGGAVTCS